MGFWPPYTVPRSAAPATGVVSGPANWLVEHPVTRADTQQSSAAIAALLEVIPQIRFIICHSMNLGTSSSTYWSDQYFPEIPCAQKSTLICLDCGRSEERR